MRWISTVKAYAKINLFLNLLGQRPDGFHDVRMVMQTVDCYDTLQVTCWERAESHTASARRIVLDDPTAVCAPEQNLIVRAYHAFYDALPLPPFPLRVTLHKNIPSQAGLGGGSSDAAAMLRVLWQAHQQPCGAAQLSHIAATLGSDVPFFLMGGTALATGKGDMLEPQPDQPPTQLILLKLRAGHVSTPQAYQWIREQNQYVSHDFTLWQQQLSSPRPEPHWPRLLYNDFETPVFTRIPQLEQIKNQLLQVGIPSLMSGSGSAMFAMVNSELERDTVRQLCPVEHYWLYPTRFVGSQTVRHAETRLE